MFGYGAPDEGTIPSHLARIFNNKGRCTRVVNFGSGNWQSSQGVVQLTRALAGGSRPDAVVFYDGINDTAVVLEGSNPGDLDSEAKAILGSAFDAQQGILRQVARHSVLVRILRNRIWAPMAESRMHERWQSLDGNAAALAAATAGVYAENLRMVDALASRYSFSAFFFLQPQPLISAKALTQEERAMRDADPQWRTEARLYRDFYAAYRAQAHLRGTRHFFDLSGIFDGMDIELFANTEHLLPEGNRIVAERIAREFGPGLR